MLDEPKTYFEWSLLTEDQIEEKDQEVWRQWKFGNALDNSSYEKFKQAREQYRANLSVV